MISSHILTTGIELDAFHKRHHEIADVSLDREYLSQSLVRGFFDDWGTLVGGYVIHRGANLRSFQPVPREELYSLRSRFKHCRIAEITGMWLDRAAVGYPSRVMVYFRCVLDALNVEADVIIASTCVPKLVPIHRNSLPRVVFHGSATHPIAGRPYWILAGSRRALLWRFAAGVMRQMARDVFGRAPLMRRTA